MSISVIEQVFNSLEQFHEEGQGTWDQPNYCNPVWLFSELRTVEDLERLVRRARGNYYSLEAVFRGWLFVTVELDSMEDAAEEFSKILVAVYPEYDDYQTIGKVAV